MSDNQYDDILDNEPTEGQGDQSPKALRDAYKAMKAEKAQIEKELNDLRTSQRQSQIEKAVEAAGLPPAAVELAAFQVTDPAEIDKWIEQKRGSFGVAAPASTPDEVGSTKPTGQASVDANLAQDIQRMQGAQAGQFNPTGHEALTASLDGATSKDDFYARLRANNLLNG